MKKLLSILVVVMIAAGAFAASTSTATADVGDAVIDCHATPASDDCMPDNYTSGDPWTIDTTCTLDDSPVLRTGGEDTVNADAALYCAGGAWMVSPTLTSKIYWTTCDRRDGDTCPLNVNSYPHNPGWDSCDWCPKLYEKAIMNARIGYCRYYWAHHIGRRKVNGRYYAISDWRGPYRYCFAP